MGLIFRCPICADTVPTWGCSTGWAGILLHCGAIGYGVAWSRLSQGQLQLLT